MHNESVPISCDANHLNSAGLRNSLLNRSTLYLGSTVASNSAVKGLKNGCPCLCIYQYILRNYFVHQHDTQLLRCNRDQVNVREFSDSDIAITTSSEGRVIDTV